MFCPQRHIRNSAASYVLTATYRYFDLNQVLQISNSLTFHLPGTSSLVVKTTSSKKQTECQVQLNSKPQQTPTVGERSTFSFLSQLQVIKFTIL